MKFHPHIRVRRPAILAILAVFLAAGSAAVAATNTFKGTGTSWNTGGNWSTGATPASTDELLVNSTSLTSGSTLTLDNSFTSQTLSFNTGASSISINANASLTTARTLTLNGGTDALGNADSIDLSPTTAGTINMGVASGVGVLTVSLGSANPINISNAAATLNMGAVVAGSSGLTKVGSGTLVLSAANTYSGGTTISGGTLQVGNGGSTGALGSGNIVDNGNLVYNQNSTSYVNLPSGSAISGNGSLSVTMGGGGSGASYYDINLTGNITLGGSLSFTQVGSNPGTNLYQGIQVLANTTLTGSSISMTGDVGEASNNGNYTLALDTSAANGPINLNISLTRSGVWYAPASFTANSGTGTITVAGTGLLSNGWNVTPVTLTGGAVNIPVNVSSVGGVTINPSLTGTVSGALSGAMSLTMGGAGTLILSGANTYTGTTTINAGILQLGDGISNTGVIASGTITDNSVLVFANPTAQNYSGVINGSGSIVQNGPGTETLSGTSISYTGGTTVNAGTLVLDVSKLTGGLNITGADIIASPGTLILSNTATGTDNTLLSSAVFSGSGTLEKTGPGYLTIWSSSSFAGLTGTLNVLAGTLAANNMGAGATAPQMSLSIASGATFDDRYNSVLSIDRLSGSGTLTHSYSDALTLSIGNNNGSSAFSGVITASGGSLSFVKNGTGTQTLSGANTYNGSTAVNAGTLKLDFSAAGAPAGNILPTGSALTMAGSTLLLNGGSTVANTEQVNGLTLAAGGNTIQLVTNATPKNLELNLGAISYSLGGGTVNFIQPSGTVSSVNGILTTTGAASTILNTNGVPFATVGGSDWAAKDATNTFIVGLSTIAGGYTLSNATTLSGNADVASGVTTTTLAGNTAITSLRFNQPQATTISVGAHILRVGGILVTSNVGNNLSTISGGSLEAASVGQELLVLENDPSSNLTISSVIIDHTSATGFNKSGPGALTLTASNSYTGTTALNAGLLNISNAYALGTGTNNFTINGGSIDNTSGGSMTTASYPETWNGNFAFVGSNPLNLGTSAVTLAGNSTVTVNASTLTVPGAIGGSYNLAKAGAGTLAITGTGSTFTGSTTVNAGILQMGDGVSSIGILAGNINNYAKLVFAEPGSSANYGGAISGTGSVTEMGPGVTTLSGYSTYTGPTNVTGGGTLVVSGGLSGSQVNVAGGTLAGVGSITGNVIVGTGSGAASSSIISPSVGGGIASQSQTAVFGNLTLNSDAAFQFTLDSGNPGSPGNSDSLYVVGNLTLTGAILTGSDIGSAPLSPGQQYVIGYVYGTITGAFANAPQGGTLLIGSNDYSIDYTSTAYGGTDIVLTSVPEPGTWAAALGGFAMLAGMRRFRRRA